MNAKISKGSISWTNRSDGHHRGGIWEASIFIDGRRLRKRSASHDVCKAWLEDVVRQYEKATPRCFVVVEAGDPRLLVRYGLQSLNMEQREEKLRRQIREAQLVLDYWKTRDFTDINAYIEQVVMPELLYFFTYNHRKGIRLAAWKRREVVYNALAIFYTRLYADIPVGNFVQSLKRMCCIYVQRGHFGFYDFVPEPVHRIVENVDYSILATKFVVKPAKK